MWVLLRWEVIGLDPLILYWPIDTSMGLRGWHGERIWANLSLVYFHKALYKQPTMLSSTHSLLGSSVSILCGAEERQKRIDKSPVSEGGGVTAGSWEDYILHLEHDLQKILNVMGWYICWPASVNFTHQSQSPNHHPENQCWALQQNCPEPRTLSHLAMNLAKGVPSGVQWDCACVLYMNIKEKVSSMSLRSVSVNDSETSKTRDSHDQTWNEKGN